MKTPLAVVAAILVGGLSYPAYASIPGVTDLPSPPCQEDLAETLHVPPGWGFAPGEVAALAAAEPGLLPELIRGARLARFLDEGHADFFELVGSFAGAGFVRRDDGPPDHPALTELQNRYLTLYFIAEKAGALRLKPVDLDDEGLSYVTEILGELPFAEPITTEPVVTTEFMSNVERFVRRHPVDARDLITHSITAQVAFLEAESKRIPDPLPAVRALARRLAGRPGEEDLALSLLLDRVMPLLDGRHPDVDLVKSRAERRRKREHLNVRLVSYCLASVLTAGTDAVAYFRTKSLGDTLMTQPFHQLMSFAVLLRDDVSVDRGLQSWLRRAYAELVLGAAVRRGPEVEQRVRAALRARLDVLRRAHRNHQKMERRAVESVGQLLKFLRVIASPPETPATLPDRRERLETYVKEVETPSPPVETPAPEAPSPVVAPEDTCPQTVRRLWTKLADPNASLAEARGRFARKLRADHAYALPLTRQGHLHRIEFSAAVLDQILDPRPGEPQDPRVWVRALMEGAARARGQAGWKKLRLAQYGRYRWEIKVKRSSYRMLGFQRDDKVWRFELIDLMH